MSKSNLNIVLTGGQGTRKTQHALNLITGKVFASFGVSDLDQSDVDDIMSTTNDRLARFTGEVLAAFTAAHNLADPIMYVLLDGVLDGKLALAFGEKIRNHHAGPAQVVLIFTTQDQSIFNFV